MPIQINKAATNPTMMMRSPLWQSAPPWCHPGGKCPLAACVVFLGRCFRPAAPPAGMNSAPTGPMDGPTTVPAAAPARPVAGTGFWAHQPGCVVQAPGQHAQHTDDHDGGDAHGGKSSIQAPSTMPPQTSKVPGSTGNTVPARPSTSSMAAHNTHSNVVSMISTVKSARTRTPDGMWRCRAGLQGSACTSGAAAPCLRHHNGLDNRCQGHGGQLQVQAKPQLYQ